MNAPDHSERSPQHVREMFARIAPRYDKINRAMCFGMDAKWRKILAACALKERRGASAVLDLACGSGDIALEISKLDSTCKITACDLCPDMLEVARKKFSGTNAEIETVCADAENLPFADSSFGACTIGFGFRNFQNRKACLKEIARVLAPDGGLFILEVARARPIFEPVQNFFMRHIVPNIASLLGGEKDDYVYLAKTTRDFPRANELGAVLKECGFKNVSTRGFAFGFVAITKAFK